MFKRISFCLFLGLVLTSCATEPEVIVKLEYKFPPSSLLQECQFATPPSIEEYTKSNFDEKERLLFEVLNQQYFFTGVCNENMRSIKEWVLLEKECSEKKDILKCPNSLPK